MTLKQRWQAKRTWAERREQLMIWLAWKLPEPIAYWVAIRVMVRGCKGNPGEQTAHEILTRNQGMYDRA